MSDECVFCRIVSGRLPAPMVYQDEHTMAFLDHRPLFLGHLVLVPREHYVALNELPAAMVGPLFSSACLLSRALEAGLGCDGSFMAVNNRVSQSVAHLHVHLVPRRPNDGLKGFFWPRIRYKDDVEVEEYRARVVEGVRRVQEADVIPT